MKRLAYRSNMALEYGISSKGKPTVLYQNFEHVKDKKRMWNNSVALSISSDNEMLSTTHYIRQQGGQ